MADLIAAKPPLSRRTFTLTLLAAPTQLAAGPCAPVKVLFVCPAGTVKSPIAREMLKRAAAARSLSVDVRARGLAPADHVSPELAARLKAERFDLRAEHAVALTPRDVAAADMVIAFDAAADSPLLKSARAWRTPSWNSDYEAAKADMNIRMIVLVEELMARRTGCAGVAP